MIALFLLDDHPMDIVNEFIRYYEYLGYSWFIALNFSHKHQLYDALLFIMNIVNI